MKHLKKYESVELDYIYLILDFSRIRNKGTSKYIFRTTINHFTNERLIFDDIYYYDNDNIETKLIHINTGKLDDPDKNSYYISKGKDEEYRMFDIKYQTSSLQDAKENLKLLIKIENYNL